MAKNTEATNSDLSAEEQALEAQILLEEKEAAEKKALEESEAKAAEEQALKDAELKAKADAHDPLNEKGEFKIIILKDSPGLKKDMTKVVSGNIANALIKKGIAGLIEAMPEKSKANIN